MVQFESLPEDKQISVLNAALCCFGKSGYEKASVADIAAAAGISKASIFQYFGSKKGLYLYLFEYACDQIIREAPSGTDDFFECIRLGTDAKMRVMARHPGMFDFLSSLVVETDETILAELKPSVESRVGQTVHKLFGHVNWGKVKPDISREMLANTVKWVHDGYLRGAIGQKDAETMRRELFTYLDFVRKACYKEEYLP